MKTVLSDERLRVGAKVAVTVVAAETVTVQDPVPVQPAPLQPMKTESALGVAVSVTTIPFAKLAAQVMPQAIPLGLLVTAPLPLPEFVTLSVGAGGPMVKVRAAEVPPPGLGETTVTNAVP